MAKIFEVTSSGRKGEWFDDFRLPAVLSGCVHEGKEYVLAPGLLANAGAITELHMHAELWEEGETSSTINYDPADWFGENAVWFCMGPTNQQHPRSAPWRWVVLVNQEGLQRGLRQGWIVEKPNANPG